jgi:hypothetical protein
VTERPGNLLACPNCLSPDFLGENAEGWRGVRTARMVEGRIVVNLTESRVYDAERTSFFCSNEKCDVECELRDRELVQLDDEGKPVLSQPAEQGRLA